MKNTSKVHTEALLNESGLRKYPWVIGLSLFLLIGLSLVIFESVFLHRMQELSLWLPTQVYFHERMLVPGGMLTYIASFLTDFFYYPVLGTLIFVALLFLVQWLTQRVFRFPTRWGLLTVIPSVLLVCCAMEIGYWMFQIKMLGYLYTAVVGFLTSLLAIRAYQCSKGYFRYVSLLLIAVVGYPLFGFYALLALLAITMIALSDRTEQKGGIVAVSLILVAVTPLFYYQFYEQTRMIRMYTAAMPAFEFIMRDLATWTPYILLYLFPLVMPWILKLKKETPQIRKTRYIVGQVLGAMAILLVLNVFWFKDPNFRAELKMDKAMQELDWKEVLNIAQKEKQTPTRLMVLNKNLALLKLGRAGDEMFHYLDGGATPKSPVDIRMMQVGGKMLYYHYAHFNFCYRWCLEDAVEYGWKAEYIKYLVKTSILSGEPKLAEKYLHTLKKTMFHKKWAEKYEKFVKKPELIAKEREFASILPLYGYEDHLDVDHTLVEIYLLNYFAKTNPPQASPLFYDAAMMSALTLKDIPTYWQCFYNYVQTHKTQRMPVHFQEAALLYGNLEKSVDISHMPFDTSVKLRFQDFMRTAQKYAVKDAEQDPKVMKIFYDRFGDTFYYFYFFIRNVKSY